MSKFKGHVDIKLNELDCDFYVSNLHKWFLAPRGCSFLYFRNLNSFSNNNECNDSIILQPSYISHGYNRGIGFNFYSRATSDKTSWFLIDECIHFYENYLGGLEKYLILSFNSFFLKISTLI